MSIKKIWGSRVNADVSTYIADDGLIFYDENDGELRLGDGVTPGGVAISVRANLITAQRLTPDEDNNDAYGLGDETHRWWDLHIGDGGIKFNGYPDRPQIVPYIPGVQVDDIVPALDNDINLGATDKRFANIYLGYQGLFLADETSDENINITVDGGTLFIDGAQNLRLGDLVIENTTLKSETPDLDISIGATDDTGFFYVKRKAQFNNTSFSSTQPMVSMNASGTTEPTTVFPDTILQTTSRPNKNSRIVQRSYGSTGNVGGDNSYSVWASYAARGNTASPAALKQNDILARLSANGYGTTTWGSGGARVEFVALENFTDSAKGTRINFWTVPVGQVASQNVASINSVGVIAAGIEFSGDDTVQTTAGIPLTQKGANSGVATLDAGGKLTAAQIPTSLTGAVVFKGVWNANTNTPTLSDSLPVGLQAGWEYVVEVGGTRDIGDGSKTFAAGDFVIYDGTHWKQVPSGNLFTSLTGGGGITVSQSTGAITLGSTATALSTAGAIVARDASGNFAANIITANLTGNVTGTVSGNAGTVTNGIYSTDTATVTNTMLAGSIANAKLTNSSVTVNGTAIALGASGTVTAAAGTLTGNTLASGVTASSLTSVGTLTNLSVTNTITGSVSGSAATLTTARNINGVSFNGSADITVTAAAGTLTGTTLNATVVTSSLTTVGTLGSLAVTNGITATNYTGLVTKSIRNAGNVTGTTLTLNVTTDDIVRCTFTDAFTVAFSNIIAGRIITLIATNTSAGDTDIITAGISSVNMQGDNTLTVTQQTTAIITYYSLDGDTANIYASAVYG